MLPLRQLTSQMFAFKVKIILVALLCPFLFVTCNEKENPDSKDLEGFIVGFDPCTIRHSYPIGYVIISKDFKDTVVTYNISDESFKMPSSVFLDAKESLYTIPEANFSNFRSSAYFPESIRYNYPVKIRYRSALANEKPSNICLGDINMGDFGTQLINNQIIVLSLSK